MVLQWVDYVVIGIMLLISASIGVYYRFTGSRQRTVEEYFSADRSMTVAPVAIALMASFMSAITMLGVSSENYMYGTQFVALYLGYALASPVTTYFYLPVFFKLQARSAFEYLERRFGVVARLVASIANTLQLLLYTGVVLYAPALALEATTGLASSTSIILIGAICTFYSTIGGIKAVLITDVFQGLLMFVSVFCVIVVALLNVEGGLPEVWRIAVEGDRIEFDSISIDPTVRHTWWSLITGGFCMFMSLYGVSQVQVQRLLTVKSLGSAQKALWWSLPMLLVLGLATSFSGLALYAIYHGCDPLTAGEITSGDMIMPFFVMEYMGHIPGLAGLFVAGIFSAGLSSISAILNSLAAVALEDYIKPIYSCSGCEFPEKRATILGKMLAVVIGLACVLVAFLAQYLGSLVQATLSITGAIGGPLVGIFTLGMFTESATEGGAVTGMLISLVLVIWTAFGQPRPSVVALPLSIDSCNSTTLAAAQAVTALNRAQSTGDSSYFYLYRISYMWYGPLGVVVTVVCGLLVSMGLRLLSKHQRTELDPDLLTPLLADRVRRRRLDAGKTSNGQILTEKPQEYGKK